MKSEHPDLPVTIAQLARSATPVAVLRPPAVRLARWALASTGIAVVSILILGVRADAAAQLSNGWFAARATATLAVAVIAAIVALLMSVPGVEPSKGARTLPLAACLVWAGMLIGAIAANRSPVDALLQVTVHPSCLLFIAATALPAWAVLARMIGQGVPLQARWTGGLAGLASLAAGALAAQFVCGDDRGAHHLLWHFAPVAGLSIVSAVAGSMVFRWSPPPMVRTDRRDVAGF